ALPLDARCKTAHRRWGSSSRSSGSSSALGQGPGHNIVNILRSHVEQQQRPIYLHPVDMDGHYPWLKPEGKSAARPKDASGRSQQASSSGDHACRAGRKRQAEGDSNADKKCGKRTKATMAKRKAKTPKGKANAMQFDS
ncbi:hypothetical protein BGZ54_002978, partial [Gamsiella multidivaricata]